MPEITDLSANELSTAIHSRTISCREVMQAYLARIEAVNPVYNAIVSLQDADSLMAQAGERDAQLARGEDLGWLHGVPQAIKDLANTAGILTTHGSPLLATNFPIEDALIVQRMKAAGCIVIGKTNTPEFGLGSHTFNEVFGHTHNAYDVTKSAGGSSGGAAVALATRMLPVADGSDFMGSLRNPAAWNNVFGFRPSQGRVPNVLTQDAWITQLSTEGPMARTVEDLAHLLDIQAGYDARAPLSIPSDDPFDAELEGLDLSTTRIGWLADLDGYLALEPGIIDVCEAGLKRLEARGCSVDAAKSDFPYDDLWESWLVWRRLLAGSRITPYMKNPENRDLIKPEALWEYDQAQGLSGVEVMDASIKRTEFYRHVLELFERYDFLALPSAQVWPFDAHLRWPERINDRTMDTYHRWMEVTTFATLAGLPAASVPVGFNDQGLSMGMQLIGPPRGDRQVLRLARRYEEAASDILAVRPQIPGF